MIGETADGGLCSGAHEIVEDAKEVGVGAISEPGRGRRAVFESGKGNGSRSHCRKTWALDFYVCMILVFFFGHGVNCMYF